MTPPDHELVIPTVGRASLRRLLHAIADEGVTVPVILVDDRPDASAPLLPAGVPGGLKTAVLRGRATGPAAARNTGRRAGRAEWVTFDDDVVPPPGWWAALAAHLTACGPEVAASQGRIQVPLPADRGPTDWERNVAGLEKAQWATADMAYR